MEKRDKPPVDAELKRRIQELIAHKGGGHNADLVEDVVENALKLLHDVEDRGDVRVIQTALRELRYAFKLFAPYANPIIQHDKKLITFKYFFTRKLIFLRHSDAIVLFPGGFGTMDEGYEALTLMQTGKSRLMPLVLIDRPGGTHWRTWDKNIREHLLRNQLIAEDDLHLYQITDDTDQAVKCITRFYRNYHSMRFVKDLLVIRLNHAPSHPAIDGLNEDFADIVAGEKIHTVEATPEEREDHDAVELPRLAFGFNRRDYGRLREMIDVLNGF